MIERVHTVLTAAVTWLTAAGAIAAILVEELADMPAVADIAAQAAVVIATATIIIRRVTPVLPDERGLTSSSNDE